MKPSRVFFPRLGVLAALAVLLMARSGRAQGLEYVKAHYTKYEYRIPMRDGKKLFTAVYVPKDDSVKYPIMLTRTPYNVGPYGVDRYKNDLGPSEHFGRDGYIIVYQDVRGRWMSEGEFVNVRPIVEHRDGSKEIDESTDTYDTIDWLIKHVKNHNGRVGMWGISYPGFYTAAGSIDAHPALKAASPQAPVTDWFVGDDWHHNGALFLPHAFNFMARFGRPRPEPTKKFDHAFDYGTPDGYDFYLRMGTLANADKLHFKGDVAFWNEMMRHGTYDAFWRARNLRAHMKAIRPATMTVGGWFDAENLFGALETYRHIEAGGPASANVLVMGPWVHGGWAGGTGETFGPISFNSKTATFFRENIQFPFFQHYLKDKGKADQPEAWVFVTGKNQWEKHSSWPPREAERRSLFFGPGGRLSFDPPAGRGDSAGDRPAHDAYVSDPDKPVPFMGEVVIDMKKEYMIADQRFASRRTDVLTYQTEVLEEDVTIAGPIEAMLHVSTTGTDSDWVVKLIDVYPDDYPDPPSNAAGVRMGGYQQLVRGDVMRGKFRDSFEHPAPFVPDQPTKVNFKLQDVYHTFRSGHRIMVHVQSTWFPLVDRNPQQFEDIYNARPDDFRKATQRVFRAPEMASHLRVRVLP